MSFKFLNKTATKFFLLEIFSFFSRGRVVQSVERPSTVGFNSTDVGLNLGSSIGVRTVVDFF